MIRKFYMTAFLAAFLLSTVSLFAAGTPSVDQILQKNVKAHGGDKLKNMKSYSSVMKMEVMGQSAEMKNFVVFPDKIRMDIDAPGQKLSIMLNGDKGWVIQNDTSIEIPAEQIAMTKSQLNMQNNIVAFNFMNYKSLGITYEFAGIEDVNGEPAYKLKETLKDSTVSHVYFSKKTFLELKKVSTMNVQGTDGTIEMIFKEQKKINGVTMPMKMEVITMGMSTAVTITEMKINPQLDDKLFMP